MPASSTPIFGIDIGGTKCAVSVLRAGQGVREVCRFATAGHDDFNVGTDQFGNETRKTVHLPVSPPRLKHNVLSFHVSELA